MSSVAPIEAIDYFSMGRALGSPVSSSGSPGCGYLLEGVLHSIGAARDRSRGCPRASRASPAHGGDDSFRAARLAQLLSRPDPKEPWWSSGRMTGPPWNLTFTPICPVAQRWRQRSFARAGRRPRQVRGRTAASESPGSSGACEATALIGPLDPVGKPSGAPKDAKALTGYAPRP